MCDDQYGCECRVFLLVPAYPGSPRQKAVKRLCVGVRACVVIAFLMLTIYIPEFLVWVSEFLIHLLYVVQFLRKFIYLDRPWDPLQLCLVRCVWLFLLLCLMWLQTETLQRCGLTVDTVEQVWWCHAQEWVHQSGQAIESVFARGGCVDKADSACGKDGTQWDPGSEGHRLSDCLHRAGNAAGEITAECWKRVCRCIPTARCRCWWRTTNSSGDVASDMLWRFCETFICNKLLVFTPEF